MGFGGWSIERPMYSWFVKNLKKGSTIVELGSGEGTAELAKHFKMHSIEHAVDFLGMYDTTYIYAPIIRRTKWYDHKVIEKLLPKSYDAILVDGPPGSKRCSRLGFVRFLHIFKTDVPIIIDDMQDEVEQKLMKELENTLGRKGTVFDGDQKKFGVIMP